MDAAHISIDDLLGRATEAGASDLHLGPGAPRKQFEVDRQLDFSYGVPDLARFRVNVHFQRDSLAAAFRHIPEELRTLEELGLPPALRELAMSPRDRSHLDRRAAHDDASARTSESS